MSDCIQYKINAMRWAIVETYFVIFFINYLFN